MVKIKCASCDGTGLITTQWAEYFCPECYGKGCHVAVTYSDNTKGAITLDKTDQED